MNKTAQEQVIENLKRMLADKGQERSALQYRRALRRVVNEIMPDAELKNIPGSETLMELPNFK